MKKRLLALGLVLLFCMSLCGCAFDFGAILNLFISGDDTSTELSGGEISPGGDKDVAGNVVIVGPDGEIIYEGDGEGEDGTIAVRPDGNGGIVTAPGTEDAPVQEDVAPEPTFFTLNETWHYFHFYASDDNLDQARLATLSLREDGTFGLGSCLQFREKGADVSWYCPGTETSGVDTPHWEGTYTWDGTMLNLTFQYRLQTVYEVDENGMMPTGQEEIPVEYDAVLTCIEENEHGYYMDATPLPLYSDLTGIDAGYVQMYVGERINLDTLFP